MGYPFTPGTGATAAADVVGAAAAPSATQLIPYMKLDKGTAGASVPVEPGAGLPVVVETKTTGGATPYKLISANTTNATSVKGSAGTLYYVGGFNTNAAARYLKFYNKASAPTVGSDTPVWTFLIPPNSTGAALSAAIPPQGIAFSLGIAFALTTGVADADTGAVAAAEIGVNLGYA